MADLDSLPENALWSLASLQELRILNCPRLRFLPPELRFLTSLRQLEISKCPLLEERYGDLDQMDADWTSISHIPNIQIGDKRIQQEASFLLERKNPAQSVSGCFLFRFASSIILYLHLSDSVMCAQDNKL